MGHHPAKWPIKNKSSAHEEKTRINFVFVFVTAIADHADPTQSTVMDSTTSAATSQEEVPVVNVYKEANSITLKWGEGGSKQTIAPLSALYSIAPYSFSAEDLNGDELFIKTFGSLPNCNGGVLTTGGGSAIEFAGSSKARVTHMKPLVNVSQGFVSLSCCVDATCFVCSPVTLTCLSWSTSLCLKSKWPQSRGCKYKFNS